MVHRRGPASSLIPLLPGLWSVVFGLAIFSARPYLPLASGWVALWYLGVGAVLARHSAG